MLKRRLTRNQDALPTTTKSNVDGSGLSVKMDAPIVKAARNASAYTRNSYIWCFTSIFCTYWCWNHIWYHYATTFLECHDDECVLKILPPKRAKKLTLNLVRDQIVISEAAKVDVNGEKDRGNFDSYTILFNQYGKLAHVDSFDVQKERVQTKVDTMTEEQLEVMKKYGTAAFTDPDLREQLLKHKTEIVEEAVDPVREEPKRQQQVLNYDLPNLEALEPYATNLGSGEYLLVMRKYNVEHRRRRVTSLINKINLYASGKKNALTIRENRNVVWQAILGMIFGVFSLMFALLLGQYSEPEKKRNKTRGPGSRRTMGGNPSRSTTMSHRQNRSQAAQTRTKAYGGYNVGSSSYSY